MNVCHKFSCLTKQWLLLSQTCSHNVNWCEWVVSTLRSCEDRCHESLHKDCVYLMVFDSESYLLNIWFNAVCSPECERLASIVNYESLYRRSADLLLDWVFNGASNITYFYWIASGVFYAFLSFIKNSDNKKTPAGSGRTGVLCPSSKQLNHKFDSQR